MEIPQDCRLIQRGDMICRRNKAEKRHNLHIKIAGRSIVIIIYDVYGGIKHFSDSEVNLAVVTVTFRPNM